jgi:hypothetical protein
MIEFRKGTVSFQIADARETATFTCTGGAIRARAGDREYVGQYDAANARLVFNGVEYEALK